MNIFILDNVTFARLSPINPFLCTTNCSTPAEVFADVKMDEYHLDVRTAFLEGLLKIAVHVAGDCLDGRSYLIEPLSECRMLFLQSLGLDEPVFTDRVVPSLTYRRGCPIVDRPMIIASHEHGLLCRWRDAERPTHVPDAPVITPIASRWPLCAP